MQAPFSKVTLEEWKLLDPVETKSENYIPNPLKADLLGDNPH